MPKPSVDHLREPLLQPVALSKLRPTQITVGMIEVEARRKHWRKEARDPKRLAKFLQTHLIPVILGADGRHYILDHHHLALALHREGQKEMYVTVVADLSALDKETFWFVLDQRNWMHPFDKKGIRRPWRAIPKSVTGLEDDPYRSLAGELRRLGGFAKDVTPYSEFLWADFLRKRVGERAVKKDFGQALEESLALAKTREAGYLPGWCGATSDMTSP